MQRRMGYFVKSRFCQLIFGVSGKLKFWVRSSLLGKLSEARAVNPMILQESKIVKQVIGLCEVFNKKIKNYLLKSRVNILVSQLIRQIYFFSLRTTAIIIITALLTNTVLLMLLDEIGPWSYFVRGLLLFTAVALLFSGADWPAVKKSSLVLRLILKDKECAVFAEK